MDKKTLLQLLHSFVAALATAGLAFFSHVDVATLGTGATALVAGAVVALVVRGAGWLVNKVGPATS